MSEIKCQINSNISNIYAYDWQKLAHTDNGVSHIGLHVFPIFIYYYHQVYGVEILAKAPKFPHNNLSVFFSKTKGQYWKNEWTYLPAPLLLVPRNFLISVGVWGHLGISAAMAPANGVDTSEGKKARAPGVDTRTSGVRGYFDRLLIGVWCCAGRGRVDLLGVERPEPE